MTRAKPKTDGKPRGAYRPQAAEGSRAEGQGDRLAAMRRAAGITQEELAKRRGITQSTVAKHETGKRRLSLDLLLLYARALDCDPGKLDPALAPARPGRR